jgi:hypothetical protein
MRRKVPSDLDLPVACTSRPPPADVHNRVTVVGAIPDGILDAMRGPEEELPTLLAAPPPDEDDSVAGLEVLVDVSADELFAAEDLEELAPPAPARSRFEDSRLVTALAVVASLLAGWVVVAMVWSLIRAYR